MTGLGQKQTLKIAKKTDFGVYLAGPEGEEILLPKKQVPAGAGIGDPVEVFLYRDSEDRPIATVHMPLRTLGGLARLRVRDVNKNGAYLDWGLEKDLFLPYREQTYRVKAGDEVLVTLYLDKSERLCATMNVYEALSAETPYRKDSRVCGTVYLISERFGAYVAVDDRYSALIPKKEMYGAAEKLRVGAQTEARVARVLEDGRLELSVRDKGALQRTEDAQLLEERMRRSGGKLPFTDKASPETIAEETGMSKAQFKRAVGKLLKEGKIEITQREILYKG